MSWVVPWQLETTRTWDLGSGMSRVVPWQLGTTRTWDWQGGVKLGDVPGCPGFSHGNLGQFGPGTGRVVLGSGMSRDVLGCPMATWDNWDLGLAGWCKVVGCPGMS